MAWLSPAECLLYAPGIQLSGDALLSAITIAQIFAEGINGANRPLQITSFTKVLTVPSDSRIQLPIAPLLLSPAPIVRMRGSDLGSRFGAYSNQEWEELAITDYIIDPANNEIALSGVNGLLQGNSDYSGFRGRTHTPTSPRRQNQVRITYSSGFDFSVANAETTALKVFLANIVAVRQSAQSQGVKRLEISDEEYKIEYASQNDFSGISARGGGVNGSPINEYLSLFRKYRPVEFVL